MKTKTLIYALSVSALILNAGVYLTFFSIDDTSTQASLLLWWPIVSLALFIIIAVLVHESTTMKVYFLDKDFAKYMQTEESNKSTLSRKEAKYLSERQIVKEYTLLEFADEFNNNRLEGHIYIEK